MSMIVCKNCGEQHPEYFMQCNKCGYSEAEVKNYEKNYAEARKDTVQEDSILNVFEIGFNRFATISIIRVLYVLVLVSAPVVCFIGISAVISLPITSTWLKIIFSVGVILATLIELILVRLVFETIVVIFRLEKNSRR